MTLPLDSILIVGFGGPTKKGEARPFVEKLSGDAPGAAERIEEVVRHYEMFGEVSPFNEETLRQAEALQHNLEKRGRPLPVYVGMINWGPYAADVLKQMAQDGRRRAAAFVMSVYRSRVSWDNYLGAVEQARAELGDSAPEIEFVEPDWHLSDGFVQAMAGRVAGAMDGLTEDEKKNAKLIFTAHAIPEAAAGRSPYVGQYEAAAAAIARAAGKEEWAVSYQSRPTHSRIPWTGPAVCDAVEAAAKEGARRVVVAPIGFLVDHIEVLYDLDVEAKAAAENCGIEYRRAGTVIDHPKFIDLMADRLLEKETGFAS